MLHISYRESFFETPDGTKLYRRSWGEAKKGLFLIVHGFAEHVGRYQFLAKALSDAGYGVESFDCRGHGRSSGTRAHINRFQEYVDDLGVFIRVVKREYPDNPPTFLFGHSQGGHIVLRYALQNPQAHFLGIIVSAPFLGLAMKVPPAKKLAAMAASLLVPKMSQSSGLKEEELTHNPEVVESTRRDPYYLRIARARWVTETLTTQKLTLEQADSFSFPLLMQIAGEDRIVDKFVARDFFEQVHVPNSQCIEYNGYFHEIFNETLQRRELAFSDLKTWVEERIATPQ